LSVIESFTTNEEDALSNAFLSQGYVIQDVDNMDALLALRRAVVEIACEHLGLDMPDDEADFLNQIHEKVTVAKLNDFRLAIYNGMNAHDWFRPTYYGLGKSIVKTVVGNELAMQNRVNLSIQMPDDDSSLISIHSDAFSGETPFQVVQWLPLVDVYDTKSMFYLPPDKNREVWPKLKELAAEGGSDRWFDEVKDHVKWLDIPFGKILVFSPNILHGNIINRVPETRWSLNCRFTGLFTPYASHEKSLGGFYLPITLRPVSQIGMSYQPPEGF